MYKKLDTPNCGRENGLIEFLHGELDEPTARDFERHLTNCADCESELREFKQIRSSVLAWRQETVGAATVRSVSASQASARASDLGKPSAMAALRQFFDLSSLGMKGSIAFASVLFCVVSALALAHLFENPKPDVAGDEKRYTEKELQAKIEYALKSRLPDAETQEPTLLPSIANDNNHQLKPQRRGPIRSSAGVGANPKVGRGPLTKAEREQLAADLRLILPQDDTDLELLSDGINQ